MRAMSNKNSTKKNLHITIFHKILTDRIEQHVGILCYDQEGMELPVCPLQYEMLAYIIS